MNNSEDEMLELLEEIDESSSNSVTKVSKNPFTNDDETEKKGAFHSFCRDYFSFKIPLEQRVSYIILFSSMLITMLALFLTCMTRWTAFGKICSIVLALIVCVLLHIGFKIRKVEHFIFAVLVLYFNILIPFLFFTEGGFAGSIPFLMVMNTICIAFSSKSAKRYILLIFSLIEDVVLFLLVHKIPDLVTPIPQGLVFLDFMFGFIICYVFIACLCLFVSKQNDKDRDSMLRLSQLFEQQSNTDELTGLNNRRYFKILLNLAISAVEDPERYHIAMFDIDNFKKINDKYGHPFGDRVISTVARILKEESQNESFACRYGGEEFLIFMSNIDKIQALGIVQNVLQKVRSTNVSDGVQEARITVSAGLRTFSSGITYESLMEFVDNNLYAAKNAGKDRVIY